MGYSASQLRLKAKCQVTATDQQTTCSACGAGGAQTAISTQTAVRPAPDHVWFPCHVAQRREPQVQSVPRSKLSSRSYKPDS